MKHGRYGIRKESGVALVALLVLLIMAGAYAFYRSANFNFGRSQQDQKLQLRLAQAKEALIAYAITDNKRPGRLLCPDLIGDGISPLLSRDDCDAYIGWLPWKTLDLGDATDDHGTKLRYVALRWFGGDRPKPPLNSDTLSTIQLAEASITPSSLESTPLGTLYLDIPIGSGTDATDLKNDIVALIIAPRGELDARNADSDHYFFSGNSSSNADNDIIMPVTRQELMAAVEKRVANEVKHCIEQHAAASANATRAYPWPAPFSATGFQGKAGSYFGQVPATQPGAGPEAALEQSIAQIQAASSALTSATTPQDQLTAVKQLGEALTQARNLYDALYVAATRLWQSASVVVTYSASLDSELARDLRPSRTGRISIIDSEQTRIRDQAQTLRDQIDTLPVALDQTGIDAFPNALKTRTDLFQQQASVANAQAIQLLLASSATAHADIGPTLAAALAASAPAVTAAGNLALVPSDTGLAALAQASATTFVDAINTLQTTINSSRINRHYSEISPYATQIASLNDLLRGAPTAANAATLAAKLSETKILLQGISTAASAINASRNASLNALDQALTAALAAADYPLIDATASSVAISINSLVTTMIVNDDNLTRTSLAAAVGSYNNEQAIFATINATNTGRVPYALNLQNATVNAEFWANIIKSEANALASQAKGLPIAVGQDFASVTPLGTSTYQGADTALASSQVAATAIQTYINTPTTAKQTIAANALANTLTTTASALGDANTLGINLSSSAASAFPIIWLSSSCDAFRDTANSWWTYNQWRGLVFYQISDATLSASPGRLTVNQTGNYRVVAINAGRALSGQNRSLRSAANYFEDINADASRSGDATTPVSTFSNAPISGTFNDRLAY